MNEAEASPKSWYWVVVGVLLLAGAGALTTAGQKKPVAIYYDAVARGGHYNSEPTVQDVAQAFHQFRGEVQQLAPEQQQGVWQSLLSRTESLAEKTLYSFFALPEDQQRQLLDRTVDRFEARRQMWEQWQQRGWGSSEDDERPYRGWSVREVSGEPDWTRPFAELSLEERLSLRRDMWEETTTQSSAMRSEFLRMVNERRKERGLPEPFRRSG